MAEEEAGMDPPFLAVPVGRLIGHDALSDAVTATWQGQCAGWRVIVDAVDGAPLATSGALEVVHDIGRHETRRFASTGPGPAGGQPTWRRAQ
jgi:hypothetical protein